MAKSLAKRLPPLQPAQVGPLMSQLEKVVRKLQVWPSSPPSTYCTPTSLPTSSRPPSRQLCRPAGMMRRFHPAQIHSSRPCAQAHIGEDPNKRSGRAAGSVPAALAEVTSGHSPVNSGSPSPPRSSAAVQEIARRLAAGEDLDLNVVTEEENAAAKEAMDTDFERNRASMWRRRRGRHGHHSL